MGNWLGSYDAFKDDFLHYVYFLSKGCGYYPHVDFPKLKIAHAGWCAECQLWESNYVMKDSNGLSHLKIMSILLVSLASVEWVQELEEYDPTGGHDEGEFAGSSDAMRETRLDINAGRGTFFAFQFVVAVINSFEISRDDKCQKFEFRLTSDLEHDIMVWLLSERRDPMAMFLILKSLYIRDSVS
ncbi:hypothetical protein XH84_14655 [Bradyrhizobium nanningense]|nr:hypothetical protein XH84_14655 [Bradyrhizobium nanningense]